jgi:hypothetical protein
MALPSPILRSSAGAGWAESVNGSRDVGSKTRLTQEASLGL